MKREEIIDIVREAYRWGRANGAKKTEMNFNDFIHSPDFLNLIKLHEGEKMRADKWIDKNYGLAHINADGFGDIKFYSRGTVLIMMEQYANQ